MNNLSIFLNENLNIDVNDYFNLKEEDKNYITEFITNTYSKNLDREPHLIGLYLDVISRVIRDLVEQESYELADIMKRSYIALDEKYHYYKHFPKED